MAFNPAGNTNQAQDNVRQASWEAEGFLNVYMPTQDGGRMKVGAIPLRKSKPRELQLAQYLAQDPDGVRIANVMAKLEIEYGSVAQTDGKGFDLS
jgi:hypothetical protein